MSTRNIIACKNTRKVLTTYLKSYTLYSTLLLPDPALYISDLLVMWEPEIFGIVMWNPQRKPLRFNMNQTNY